MRYRVLNNGILEFFDATANTVGSIGANGANMRIAANNGVIELGITPSDVQVGTVGTLTNWTFLGGGRIGASGTGVISMGQSGDTVNMNVSGVVYQYPSSFLRFNEISGANNKINITTQVPGSVILNLPNRPVVGALTLTDNIISTSNTTGTLTVGGGLGVSGNVNVSNTINILSLGTEDRPWTIQGGQSGVIGARMGAAEALDFYTVGFPVLFSTGGAARTQIQFVLTHTASAVNYLQVTGNTTGGSPVLSAQGSDTNVGINLLPKGNGSVNVRSTATSTSNTSGALVVTGGMGITGNLFMSAGNNYTTSTSQASYRLGWTDNYFQRSAVFGGMLVQGSYFELDTTTYLGIGRNFIARGVISNDQGNNTVLFAGSSPVRLQNTAVTTSSTTGALLVDGGIGVTGNVYVQSPLFRDSVLRVTTFSANANLDLITAGAGAANFRISSSSFATLYMTGSGVNANIVGFQATTLNVGSHFSSSNLQIYTGTTGSASLKIYGEGTGAAYANIGSTTSVGSQVNIISSLPSTSHTTGALVVSGGLGVSGNISTSITTTSRIGWSTDYLFREGNGNLGFRASPGSIFTFSDVHPIIQPSYQLRSRGTIVNDTGNNAVIFGSSSTVLIQSVTGTISNTTGALIVDGGIGVKRGIYARNLELAGGFQSTSNTTGTLVVQGGVGVTGNIFVGGTSAGSTGVYTDILRYSANGQPWSFGTGGGGGGSTGFEQTFLLMGA